MRSGTRFFICKRIIESIGGTLEVVSEPGVKTIFKITLEALKIRAAPAVSGFCFDFAATQL